MGTEPSLGKLSITSQMVPLEEPVTCPPPAPNEGCVPTLALPEQGLKCPEPTAAFCTGDLLVGTPASPAPPCSQWRGLRVADREVFYQKGTETRSLGFNKALDLEAGTSRVNIQLVDLFVGVRWVCVCCWGCQRVGEHLWRTAACGVTLSHKYKSPVYIWSSLIWTIGSHITWRFKTL